MSEELTKKWKNGTLSLNYYYIKLQSGKYGIDHTVMSIDGDLPKTKFAYSNFAIEEVLAPVPTYDEYKELVSNSDELVQKIHILNEQNTKQYNELCEEIKKNNILEKKLEIATKALKEYESAAGWGRQAFLALKEMEGVK